MSQDPRDDGFPNQHRYYFTTHLGALRMEAWLLAKAHQRLDLAAIARDRGRRQEMREQARWWREYMRLHRQLVLGELSR